jgi:hypothetical protein
MRARYSLERGNLMGAEAFSSWWMLGYAIVVSIGAGFSSPTRRERRHYEVPSARRRADA